MEYAPQLIAIAGFVLLACASPGPDFVAVTSHALIDRRSAVFVGLGIACSVAVWATLAILGFGLLISELTWLYEVIRFIGAAYLIYLGLRMLLAARRSGDTSGAAALSTAISVEKAWRRGFLVGITNPKTATFFGTLFVTLLPVGAPISVYAAVIALVTLITCLWLCLLASFFSVNAVRSGYMRIRRPVDAILGATLVGFGLKIATSK